MLVLLTPNSDESAREAVYEALRQAGCRWREVGTDHGPMLILEGDLDGARRTPLSVFPAVRKVIPLRSPYTLSSREHQPQPTIVEVGDVRIGDGSLTLIAGPCAVENPEQLLQTARAVKASGANILRGGAYKPRTSPYSFRGLGTEGLRLLREVSLETGLPTVSEVMDPRHVEACVSNVDMLQVGTRNMSNFDLLVEIGRSGHPVLLKRGRAATIKDWLLAAEYVLAQGNPNVVLCERGVRGFDPATRNLLDLTAVPTVRQRSHLPIAVDPSHATGHADLVPPMARAACAAGADAIMTEVHVHPERAQCDAEQALLPAQFAELAEDLRLLAQVVRRHKEETAG